MAKKPVHVVPSGGKWVVKKEGASAATSKHKNQTTAWKRGQSIARKEGTEAYLHGKDGRIRERNSYGRDPHPPQG